MNVIYTQGTPPRYMCSKYHIKYTFLTDQCPLSVLDVWGIHHLCPGDNEFWMYPIEIINATHSMIEAQLQCLLTFQVMDFMPIPTCAVSFYQGRLDLFLPVPLGA